MNLIARPLRRCLVRRCSTGAPSEGLNLVGIDPMKNPANKDPRKLFREIVSKIKFGGPLTVSEYMQEVLSNPVSGYYINQDVFGVRGDFTTSPEISQMFGECLAIWFVHEWMKLGSPRPLNIVELGPGRGTLMSDVLRVFGKLVPDVMREMQVYLVEISPKMKETQRKTLKKHASMLNWCGRIEEVPKVFTLFIAHEFFDALPIHKFVRVESSGEWREVLVDIDKDDGLRFVRARHKTPAVELLPDLTSYSGSGIEISPKSGLIVRKMADRIFEFGGISLIADYGVDGPAVDSFRAFRKHKLHDPLKEPGTADFTADVDFRYLKSQCNDGTICYGPAPQGEFLGNLGIRVRLEKLLQNTFDQKTKNELKSAHQKLTSKDEMGERFKFVSIFPRVALPIHEKVPPVGFKLVQ